MKRRRVLAPPGPPANHEIDAARHQVERFAQQLEQIICNVGVTYFKLYREPRRHDPDDAYSTFVLGNEEFLRASIDMGDMFKAQLGLWLQLTNPARRRL